MPTHYKAVTTHKSINYRRDLNLIHRYFTIQKSKELVAVYKRWGANSVMRDDRIALVRALRVRLTWFALECNAWPQRTPAKLLATARLIEKRPAEYLSNAGKYDPEVEAIICGALRGLSEEHSKQIALFEAGAGPAPSPKDVARAARKVIEHLEQKRREKSFVGGQSLVLQRSLVWDLASIFAGTGGRVTRVTRLRGEGTHDRFYEDGAFSQFLALVLPAVRPFARKAGFAMESTQSMLIRLRKDGFGKGKKPAELGASCKPSYTTQSITYDHTNDDVLSVVVTSTPTGGDNGHPVQEQREHIRSRPRRNAPHTG